MFILSTNKPIIRLQWNNEYRNIQIVKNYGSVKSHYNLVGLNQLHRFLQNAHTEIGRKNKKSQSIRSCAIFKKINMLILIFLNKKLHLNIFFYNTAIWSGYVWCRWLKWNLRPLYLNNVKIFCQMGIFWFNWPDLRLHEYSLSTDISK